jgi:molybdopterin molybdotransferase
MLSIKEAKEILFENVFHLPAQTIPVKDALGLILAADILSPVDLPLFDHSAMDGFAVYSKDLISANEELIFQITGEMKAGAKPFLKLKDRTAIAIYTGAAVPSNATSVVMQEKVLVKDKIVVIHSSSIVPGGNIRKKGSQIRKGELALSKGMIINPAAIGFISSMGIQKIKVFRKPIISILATGDELMKAGKKLMPGKIFESNSIMLEAAVKACGFNTNLVQSVKDRDIIIFEKLKKMLTVSDVIVISGGISVGKYDLVQDVLEKLKVKQLFYKVAQKPGKPFFTGRIKNKLIFAVPGNPAAALVCFYEYILPSLKKMSGFKNFNNEHKFLPIKNDYELKGDRDVFLRARMEHDEVTILGGQESNILKSFAEANALVYLPAGSRFIKRGSKVETHLI